MSHAGTGSLSAPRALELAKAVRKICRNRPSRDDADDGGAEAEAQRRFMSVVRRYHVSEEEIQLLARESPEFMPCVRGRANWPDRAEQMTVLETMQEDDESIYSDGNLVISGIEDPSLRQQVLDRVVAGMDLDAAMTSDAVYDDRTRLANLLARDYWPLARCVEYVAQFPADETATVQDDESSRCRIARALGEAIVDRRVADVAEMPRAELASFLAAALPPEIGGVVEKSPFSEEQLNVLGTSDLTKNDLIKLGTLEEIAKNEAVNLVAMGLTADEAIAAIEIARSFTEEQLNELRAASISRDEILRLGKLEPIAKAEAVSLIAKETQASDGDWLETHCRACRQALQDKTAFDRDALLYRRNRQQRPVFSSCSRELVNKARQEGSSPLADAMAGIFYVKHPGQWDVCTQCHGANVDRPDCSTCGGAGYLTTAAPPRPRDQ
jgi:hypothetical protein